MAVSYTSSRHLILQKLAYKHGFGDIIVQDDLSTASTRITVRVGMKQYATSIAYRDQTGKNDSENLAILDKALADLSRTVDHNDGSTLDMRWNNIESMADVLALKRRADNDARRIDTFMITPEQHKTLMKELDPMGVGVQDGYLYGCKIEVMGQ